MNTNKHNVGTLERAVRIAGGVLAAFGGSFVLLIGSSLWLNALAAASIALGLDFIYTGVTGYCPLYGKLGWTTAGTAPARRAPAAVAGIGATNGSAHKSVRVVLPVAMPCAGDAMSAERLIGKLPGVLHAYVNPVTENAYVDYDPERATSEAIAAEVRELGYAAKVSAR
jgi:copper chaperone CopZ